VRAGLVKNKSRARKKSVEGLMELLARDMKYGAGNMIFARDSLSKKERPCCQHQLPQKKIGTKETQTKPEPKQTTSLHFLTTQDARGALQAGHV
jgi:hypothetical protein